MTVEKILIVDSDILIRNFLVETLRRRHFDVNGIENGMKALAMIKQEHYDLVIADMVMSDITGLELLKQLKEHSPTTLTVILTASGSIENAVEAMSLGAFNYLIKPCSPDTIEAVIAKAKEHAHLVAENHYLRQQLAPNSMRQKHTMVCESPAMQKVFKEIINIANSHASVFIHGESGTGKEVIAHAIHNQSQRASRPFIKVNCAAIPETLIEAEFFGHEKGAFTGASQRRIGRFELAHMGTLLLDEITETPLALQAKLLRVTQEQEFERIGGSKSIKVDVRLISTSNRSIEDAIAGKMLREDLYYRLNVVPIYLPPLRERKEDILPLANYFLDKLSEECRSPRKSLSQAAIDKLLSYHWPGNIRELANVIERAIVINDAESIGKEHLLIGSQCLTQNPALPAGISLKEIEKLCIKETLSMQDEDLEKTAKILGISVRTLRSKISLHKLSRLITQ